MKISNAIIVLTAIIVFLAPDKARAGIEANSVVDCTVTPANLQTNIFDTNQNFHHFMIDASHYKVNSSGGLVKSHARAGGPTYGIQLNANDDDHDTDYNMWRISATAFWADCGSGEGTEWNEIPDVDDNNGCGAN